MFRRLPNDGFVFGGIEHCIHSPVAKILIDYFCTEFLSGFILTFPCSVFQHVLHYLLLLLSVIHVTFCIT